MARTKREKPDVRIDRVYRTACSGMQIDVMKIGKVFAAGREAIAAGADDDELGRTLRTAVNVLMAD